MNTCPGNHTFGRCDRDECDFQRPGPRKVMIDGVCPGCHALLEWEVTLGTAVTFPDHCPVDLVPLVIDWDGRRDWSVRGVG